MADMWMEEDRYKIKGVPVRSFSIYWYIGFKLVLVVTMLGRIKDKAVQSIFKKSIKLVFKIHKTIEIKSRIFFFS